MRDIEVLSRAVICFAFLVTVINSSEYIQRKSGERK